MNHRWVAFPSLRDLPSSGDRSLAVSCIMAGSFSRPQEVSLGGGNEGSAAIWSCAAGCHEHSGWRHEVVCCNSEYLEALTCTTEQDDLDDM